MTRKSKVVGGILAGFAALGFCGWLVMRPDYGTAPMSELRKLIDPRLLAWREPDAEGEDRWKRLNAVINSIEELDYLSSIDAPASAIRYGAFFTLNRDRLKKMRRILAEGPAYHESPIPREDKEFSSSSLSCALTIVYAGRSMGFLRGGDTRAAVQSLDDAFLLLARMREATSSLDEWAVVDANEETLLLAVAKLATSPQLTESQARHLMAYIIPSSTPDQEMEVAVRGEFQGSVLSWLDDPIRRFHSSDTISMLSWRTPEERRKPSGLSGSYDPYETARLANSIYLSLLLNAARTPSTIDRSSERVVARLTAEVPLLPYPRYDTGWDGHVERTWFGMKMGAVSNSFGKGMLAVSPEADKLMLRSCWARTRRDCVRALLGIEIYRRRHGEPPPRLSALVSAGILKSEPYDYIGERPVTYDPRKHVLYGVGRDRVDGGGVFQEQGATWDSDFVFRIRP